MNALAPVAGTTVPINFDTGACATAIPESWVSSPGILQDVGEGPQKVYYAANGSEVRSSQKATLVGKISSTGMMIKAPGSVAPIKKMLLSGVQAMRASDSMGILGAKGGLLIQRKTPLGRRVEEEINKILLETSKEDISRSTVPLKEANGVLNIYVTVGGASADAQALSSFNVGTVVPAPK